MAPVFLLSQRRNWTRVRLSAVLRTGSHHSDGSAEEFRARVYKLDEATMVTGQR